MLAHVLPILGTSCQSRVIRSTGIWSRSSPGGTIWVLSIIGGTVWWQGQLWFAVVSALLLTAVTTWGAWREARQ